MDNKDIYISEGEPIVSVTKETDDAFVGKRPFEVTTPKDPHLDEVYTPPFTVTNDEL